MPRFDGTGPQGRGPRTGRGMGPCNTNRPVCINRFQRVLRRLYRFGRGRYMSREEYDANTTQR